MKTEKSLNMTLFYDQKQVNKTVHLFVSIEEEDKSCGLHVLFKPTQEN